jgi:hypothetical protein
VVSAHLALFAPISISLHTTHFGSVAESLRGVSRTNGRDDRRSATALPSRGYDAVFGVVTRA